MKKQPFLTDFPLTVFATARRRLQAAIRNASAIITRSSLSGYAVLFGEVLPPDFLAAIDPTARQRSFGHLPVFWAWLAQILEANASCQKALGHIQSWSATCGLPVPSSDTSSYCKARGRMNLDFLKDIHRRICRHLCSRVAGRDNWNGLNLKAVDGSSVQLMDTDENQEAYPQPTSQKKGCGFPHMGIVGLLNLGHGGWEHVETCPQSRHETIAAAALTKHLEKNDLLLGDRAFGSYELICRTLAQGAHVLMRLHQARAHALDWNHGKKISPHERLVTWRRPYQSAGSSMSREDWGTLPKTLVVRLIKLSYENRAGEKGGLILVTTLTDHLKFDGIELADLYARRWDIELKLRDLKTTLGMEFFAVKSPAMAHKTLWMSLIAFNLIRWLMQRAAGEAEQPIWHMSFKGVLDLVCASHESFRAHVGKPRKLRETMKRFIVTCATKTIDIRPFRSEPRAVKRRPKNHPLLNAPRHEYEEVFHRSRYFRKTA
ncbi:MAG: IS4 family transposase [Luteolibacter sp.]